MTATAKRTRKSAANQQSASPAVQETPDLMALSAAVWQAAAKIAAENAGETRDNLPDGAAYPTIKLMFAAEIDGQIFRRQFDGSVTVGHGSERASSSAIGADELLAWLLNQVNATTRAAILRDLPATFAANGQRLPVKEEEIEAAAETLKAVRRERVVSVRGAVNVKGESVRPSLGVIG